MIYLGLAITLINNPPDNLFLYPITDLIHRLNISLIFPFYSQFLAIISTILRLWYYQDRE